MLSFGWFLPFYRPYFQLLLECFVTSASVCPIWTHLLSPPFLPSFFHSLSLPSFPSLPPSLSSFPHSFSLACLLAFSPSLFLFPFFILLPPSLPSLPRSPTPRLKQCSWVVRTADTHMPRRPAQCSLSFPACCPPTSLFAWQVRARRRALHVFLLAVPCLVTVWPCLCLLKQKPSYCFFSFSPVTTFNQLLIQYIFGVHFITFYLFSFHCFIPNSGLCCFITECPKLFVKLRTVILCT